MARFLHRSLCLAAALLGSALAARAQDTAAEELPLLGRPVWQAIASPDGACLFLLERDVNSLGQPRPGARPSRVLVWDAGKAALDGQLRLPRGPVHLAVVGGQLAVACEEAEAVALVDPRTRQIARVVETRVNGELAAPWRILPDGPPGKMMVICRPVVAREREKVLLEIDLATWRQQALGTTDEDHGAVAGELLALQGLERGGSGHCRLVRLAEARRPAQGMERSLFFREVRPSPLDWAERGTPGPWRAVNGGSGFACRLSRNKTVLLAPDCSRAVWSVEGDLLAVHPSRPVLVLMEPTDGRRDEVQPLRVTGVHSGSGRQLWRITIRVPLPLHPGFVGPRATCPLVLPGPKTDQLVLGLWDETREENQRSRWFRADLPDSRTAGLVLRVEGDLPGEVHAGEALDFSPRVSGLPPGAAFALKRGPEGMRLDAQRCRIEFKPDETQVGKHDVEVVARVGPDEILVLFRTLRVRPRR